MAERAATDLDPYLTGQLRAVAEQLSSSVRVLFITGAGISADSGLPTYRGVGGLYEGVLTGDEIPIEEALSGATIRARPELTWKYLGQIEAACRGAQCNEAHRVIARLQDLYSVWVLTQNVDGLHAAAGSRNLIEMHGNLHRLNCTGCDHREYHADYSDLRIPPACPACGELLRPDVVLFGEMLPELQVARLYTELEKGFDLVFSIGTSSVFPYICGPVMEAVAAGVPTVEINPQKTRISRLVSYAIRTRAVTALPLIWRFLEDA